MRNLSILGVALLMLVQCGVLAAERATDPRLEQKLTYDSGYKRLHAITEDLAKQTGVTIRCGSNDLDWHVRDIPVVAYVKDMPLGKLLKTIADATHTRFTAEKKAGKAELQYRIYRTAKEDAEINSSIQARNDARLAEAEWEWDALAAYGKSLEASGIPRRTWLIARLIASLGPTARDRMLNGDTFRFSLNDAGVKATVDEMYHVLWKQEKSGVDEGYVPTTDDMENACLKIKLVDSEDFTRLDMVFGPLRYGERHFGTWHGLQEGRSLREKFPEAPPYPKPVTTVSRRTVIPGLTELHKDAEWDQPLLKTKFDLDKPEDLKEPVFLDVIRALAAASGCNIVAEDFVSHLVKQDRHGTRVQKFDDLFKKQTTIADTLRQVRGVNFFYFWLLNSSEKLIVGWDMPWTDSHANLLSEEYLTGLKSKLDGTGVELDDAVHLSSLPWRAFSRWIEFSGDLKHLAHAREFGDSGLWGLYDALESADKKLARSGSGLPLSKLDTSWVASFFSAEKRRQNLKPDDCLPFVQDTDWKMIEGEKRRRATDLEFANRAMSDPQIISTMVMRVVKEPACVVPDRLTTTDFGPAITFSDAFGSLKLSYYRMTIDYEIDGERRKTEVQSPLMLGLPVRSPAREDEIIRATFPEAKVGKEESKEEVGRSK